MGVEAQPREEINYLGWFYNLIDFLIYLLSGKLLGWRREVMPIKKTFLVPSFLDAESIVGVLRNHYEGLKFQYRHDFCLTDLHKRFGLTGYLFQIQF